MCCPGLSVISYLYVTVLVVSIDDVSSRVVSHFLRIVVFVDIVPFYPSCNLPLFIFLVCSHVVLPTRLITYHLVCVNIGIVLPGCQSFITCFMFIDVVHSIRVIIRRCLPFWCTMMSLLICFVPIIVSLSSRVVSHHCLSLCVH